MELLERDAELVQLEGLVADAAADQGGVMVVEGPAGIGKTTLVRALCDSAAARGVVVLRARCSRLERESAFGIVRQLLEPALAAGTADERMNAFRGAAGLSAALFGYQRPSARPAAGSQPQTDPGASFATLHGLYWLTANLCERAPLLVAVEDAALVRRRVVALPRLSR